MNFAFFSMPQRGNLGNLQAKSLPEPKRKPLKFSSKIMNQRRRHSSKNIFNSNQMIMTCKIYYTVLANKLMPFLESYSHFGFIDYWPIEVEFALMMM